PRNCFNRNWSTRIYMATNTVDKNIGQQRRSKCAADCSEKANAGGVGRDFVRNTPQRNAVELPASKTLTSAYQATGACTTRQTIFPIAPQRNARVRGNETYCACVLD